MLLPDLRIKNYRLFKEFEIERLARVNLIAGRNNTGKSSLLEAAYLLVNDNVPSALDDVLRVRGENGEEGTVFPLFYGYRLFPGISIEISSKSKSVKCSIPEREEIERLLEEVNQDRSRLAQAGEEGDLVFPLQIDHSGGEKPWWFLLRGEDGIVSGGFRRPFILSPGYGEHKRAFLLEGTASLHNRFREMRRLWDSISLTAQAGEIVETLKIIEPNVRGVDFLRAKDQVKVLLEGEERPVLIGSLGDGMRHLLMVAIMLVSARGGVLLVDELDTGLHYTVMVDLWRLVFRTAERLNVQVLATTHSWDCIAAFSQAWGEVEESKGLFLRLDRKVKDIIRPVAYTREELGIAAEQRIEVR